MQDTSRTQSTQRKRQLPFKKRIIKLIGRITFIVFYHASSLLRPWSVNLLGVFFGNTFYVLSARYRRVALKNLRAAYGDKKPEAEIRWMARQVFINFARGAVEFFYLLSLSRDEINAMVDVEGLERLDDALAEGKGCIVITAHYGNWELLARKMAILGYKANVIARDSDDPGMTGIANRIRENGGYKVFDRDQPIIGAFRCLKNNECLGILPDQNESNGIFVDFFSRPAATAIGPAVLSLRSGAPVLAMFAPRQPDGRYRVIVYPRIDFEPTGDEERDIRELTARITSIIECEIRNNPTQWLWLHDRWKKSEEAASVAN